MEGEKKPFTVSVEETRSGKLVVWAESEADAAWKAIRLYENGLIDMEGRPGGYACKEVCPSDDHDLRNLFHYGGGARI